MKILIPMLMESPSKQFGAGVLVLAKDTGRFLLAKRGKSITYPNQYTNFGGGSDGNETPLDTAKREFKEESGYRGRILKYFALKTNTSKRNKFEFHNYLALVPSEFEPPIVGRKTQDGDIEVQDYVWATFHEIRHRFPYGTLHYGIQDTFRQDAPKLKSILKNHTDAKIPKY